jgi:cytoskeletal protein RodZ
MENIGEYLRSLRLEKNITLEEISDKTKIKLRILEDIENSSIDKLGGKGYAKALIITYARAIDADVDKIVTMFDTIYSNSNLKFYSAQPTQPRKYLIPVNLFSIIFLIILIIILTLFTLKLYKEGKLEAPILKKISTKLDFKSTLKQDSISSKMKLLDIEEETEENIINEDALHDTTNYLKDIIFKDKSSPYEYTE